MMLRPNRSCTAREQDKRINVNWTVGAILRSGRGRASALIAGSSLVFAPVMVAHADGPAETAPAQTAQSQAAGGENLEEIVVTARRKSEVLEDVPLTVAAVTPADLEKYNLQNLKDLSGFVPGLQIVQSGNRALDSNTYRGVSFQPATGTQNSLGFYMNDTFVTNNFVTTSNFDIGQIEVLSGPQGTLRGEPSPSGSLTITTHKPDLEQFGGYALGTATAYANTNVNGAVNLPIVKDKLALRLAGLGDWNDLDGVKSVNSSDQPLFHTFAGRASLRWEPIDALEANVMYQHLYWHQDQFAEVAGTGAVGGVNPNAPAGYNGPPLNVTDRRAVETFPNTQYNRQDIVTWQLDWHTLGQVISVDGNYFRWELNNGDGNSGGNQVPGITAANPVPRQPFQFDTPSTVQHTQTDELRISSETPYFNGLLDYTAGLFYRRTNNQVNVVQLASFLPGSFGTPTAPSNPFIYHSKYTLQLIIDSPTQEEEFSEFAHLTFHLPHDFELTAGGRHINYKKDGSIEGTLLTQGVFIAAALPSNICGAINGQYGATYPGICDLPASLAIRNTTALAYTPQYLRDSPWIWNASISHKFNPNLLAYINGGSSWRPPASTVGIFNAANDPVLNELLHLKSETSINIETGVKWTFWDNRAHLNVAYYHQKFNGFIYNGQPTLYLVDNGSGTPAVNPFSFNSNPDAVVNGMDLDTFFRFTRQWNAGLTLTWSNGHLTGSEIPCSPPNGGNTPAAFPPGQHIFLCPSHASTTVTPNFNFSATSEYDQPIPTTSNIDGFIRGLYTFYGRNPNVSQYYTTPSYGILNLYAGLHSREGTWEASLFVKNILNNKTVLFSGAASPTAAGQGSLTTTFGSSGYYGAAVAPRQEAGITVSYAFGSR
jgi:iron complex outermembrane receptor protein